MPRAAVSNRIKPRNMGTSLFFGAVAGTSRVEIAENALLKPAAITCECWVKPMVDAGGNSLLTMYQAFMVKSTDDTWADGYGLVADTANVMFFVNNSAGAGVATFPISDLVFDRWYHIVGTYDGANVIIYLNGTSKMTTPYSTAITHATTALCLGNDPATAYEITGYGDDFRLYSAALTSTEVQDRYFRDKNITTGLVGKWLLDEGSGTDALDSSGNSLDGTITAATYSTDVAISLRAAISNRVAIVNAQNLFTRSQEFDHADWTKVNLTPSANTTDTLDPYGGNNAEKFTDSSDGGLTSHRFQQYTAAYAVTASQLCTVSIFLKAGTKDKIFIGGNNGLVGNYFNLGTGAISGTVGSPTSNGIKAIGNGWYHCWVTFAASTTQRTYNFTFSDDGTTDTYTGDGTGTMYAFGAQFIKTNWPGIYTVTTSAAVNQTANVRFLIT